MKGVTYSRLSRIDRGKIIYDEVRKTYERVWDVADFVIPPSENNAFFVLTNTIITPNQTRGTCPEDHSEMPDVVCNKHGRLIPPASNHNQKQAVDCKRGRIPYYKSHGAETGRCVQNDRLKSKKDVYVCAISGWCPVEHDELLMDEEPLVPETEYFTVLIKNAISFPWFHEHKFKRNNMPNGICVYNPNNETSWLCPIFRLGDIVALAGGN